MKSILLLCFLIAILELTLAAHASGLRMTHGGQNIESCNEAYKSTMTTLEEQRKTEKDACVAEADVKRTQEQESAQEQRSNLDAQAQQIEGSLNACKAVKDTSEYFICMKDGAKGSDGNVDEIEQQSRRGYKNLKTALESIKWSEDLCVSKVNRKATKDEDAASMALLKCKQ